MMHNYRFLNYFDEIFDNLRLCFHLTVVNLTYKKIKENFKTRYKIQVSIDFFSNEFFYQAKLKIRLKIHFILI